MKTLILSVLALLVTLVILRALGIITDEFTLVDCRNHAKNRTGKELSNVELVLVVFFFRKIFPSLRAIVRCFFCRSSIVCFFALSQTIKMRQM